MVLDLDEQLERAVTPGRGVGQDGHEPRGERVGIDDDREPAPLTAARRQLTHDVRLQLGHLPREPQQDLPVRGRPTRRRAHDEHPTPVLLQGLDPLTHRRRRDVQGPRRGLERPAVDDGDERCELIGVHEAMLMDPQNHSLV